MLITIPDIGRYYPPRISYGPEIGVGGKIGGKEAATSADIAG
jgi:hypothetical protein